MLDNPDELRFLEDDFYDELPRVIVFGSVYLVDEFVDEWRIIEKPAGMDHEYLDDVGALVIRI
jgi:hypothetical protein